MNETNEAPSLEELTRKELGQPEKFPCRYKRCPKHSEPFGTAQQLRMHIIRMHTHKELSEARSRLATKKYRKMVTRAEKQAIYARNWRKRNLDKGLTTAGTPPRRSPPKDSEYFQRKRNKYREQVARYHAQGLTAKGTPFVNKQDAYLRARQRNWDKGLNAAGQPFSKTMPMPSLRKNQSESGHYVWPLPQPDLDVAKQIKYCPHCGNNLEKHLS